MKTKTLALTLALLPALAGARDLRPGTFEVGAGTELSFGSATLEAPGEPDQDVSNVTVDADALYYLVNNLGVGLAFSYDRTEFDTGFGGDVELTSTLVGPQLKFNLPIAPSASLAVRGAVARIAQESGPSDADGIAFVLGGGLRFFATDWVSLDAMLDYTNASIEDDFGNEADQSGWDLTVGFSFYFGGR